MVKLFGKRFQATCDVCGVKSSISSDYGITLWDKLFNRKRYWMTVWMFLTDLQYEYDWIGIKYTTGKLWQVRCQRCK